MHLSASLHILTTNVCYFGFLWLLLLFPCVLFYLPKRFRWKLIIFSKFKNYLSGCNNRRHNFFKTFYSHLGTLEENWLDFEFAWRAWSGNRVSEDSDSSWIYFEISFWNKLSYHVRGPLWMDHKSTVQRFSGQMQFLNRDLCMAMQLKLFWYLGWVWLAGGVFLFLVGWFFCVWIFLPSLQTYEVIVVFPSDTLSMEHGLIVCFSLHWSVNTRINSVYFSLSKYF